MKVLKNMLVQNNQNPINFSGKRLPHQSFDEFEKFARQTDLLSHFADALRPNNFLAAGNYNRVYNISGNDVFLLRISKKVSDEKALKQATSLHKVEDVFPLNNLGQSIAKIGEHVSVIIKQAGEVFGIQNWYQLRNGTPFGKENLPEFIQKLKTLSEFGQDSYNVFASEVKLVLSKGFCLDHNPKNVLLDKANQQINIIDLENVHPGTGFFFPPSSHSILSAFLDRPDFLRGYAVANDAQKSDMLSSAKEIRDKINKAANQESLPKNGFGFKSRLFIKGILRGKNELRDYNQFEKFVDSL